MRIVCCTDYSPERGGDGVQYGPNCGFWGVVDAVEGIGGNIILQPVAGRAPACGYQMNEGRAYLVPEEDTFYDCGIEDVPSEVWAQLFAATLAGETTHE